MLSFFSFQTLMYSGNNNDFDSYNIFVQTHVVDPISRDHLRLDCFAYDYIVNIADTWDRQMRTELNFCGRLDCYQCSDSSGFNCSFYLLSHANWLRRVIFVLFSYNSLTRQNSMPSCRIGFSLDLNDYDWPACSYC